MKEARGEGDRELLKKLSVGEWQETTPLQPPGAGDSVKLN